MRLSSVLQDGRTVTLLATPQGGAVSSFQVDDRQILFPLQSIRAADTKSIILRGGSAFRFPFWGNAPLWWNSERDPNYMGDRLMSVCSMSDVAIRFQYTHWPVGRYYPWHFHAHVSLLLTPTGFQHEITVLREGACTNPEPMPYCLGARVVAATERPLVGGRMPITEMAREEDFYQFGLWADWEKELYVRMRLIQAQPDSFVEIRRDRSDHHCIDLARNSNESDEPQVLLPGEQIQFGYAVEVGPFKQ